MIESHASDWNVHLQGTRQLVTNQGWNATSGGLAQAVCVLTIPRLWLLTDALLVVLLDILPDDLGLDLSTHCHANPYRAMASNTDILESTTLRFGFMVKQDRILAGLLTQSTLFNATGCPI